MCMASVKDAQADDAMAKWRMSLKGPFPTFPLFHFIIF